MAPHVEDAKDRLIALGRPVPSQPRSIGREPGRGREPRTGQAHATRGAALLPTALDGRCRARRRPDDEGSAADLCARGQQARRWRLITSRWGRPPAPARGIAVGRHRERHRATAQRPARSQRPSLRMSPKLAGPACGAEIVQPSTMAAAERRLRRRRQSAGDSAMSGGLPAPAAGPRQQLSPTTAA